MLMRPFLARRRSPRWLRCAVPAPAAASAAASAAITGGRLSRKAVPPIGQAMAAMRSAGMPSSRKPRSNLARLVRRADQPEIGEVAALEHRAAQREVEAVAVGEDEGGAAGAVRCSISASGRSVTTTSTPGWGGGRELVGAAVDPAQAQRQRRQGRRQGAADMAGAEQQHERAAQPRRRLRRPRARPARPRRRGAGGGRHGRRSTGRRPGPAAARPGSRDRRWPAARGRGRCLPIPAGRRRSCRSCARR